MRIAGELAEELGRARLGDGAQMVDGVFARQADAVVTDGDGALVLVGFDPDAQLAVIGEQLRLL